MKISFQGTLVQTVDFSRKADIIETNWKAAEALIKKAESIGLEAKPTKVSPNNAETLSNSFTWIGVKGELITEFLNQYRGHPAARTVKTDKLKEYIQKQLNNGSLGKWTILFSGGGELDEAQLGKTAKVKRAKREWNLKGTTMTDLQNADHFRIKVLTKPTDELTGVSKKVWNEALEKDISDWEANGKIRRNKIVKKPETPGGKFIRKSKNQNEGLLVLYPLGSNNGQVDGVSTKPILGFAISFPAVHTLGDTPVVYYSNNVYQQMEMQFDE